MARNIDQSESNGDDHILIISLYPLFFALHIRMVGGVQMTQQLRYKALLDAVESFIKNALDVQVTDESNSDYGGFRCPDHLICELWSAVNTFTTMVIIFFNSDSQYYHSQTLLQRMVMTLRFITNSQNDDGTINIFFLGKIKTTTNLAYILNTLLKSYRLITRDCSILKILNSLESILKKIVNTLKLDNEQQQTQRIAIASTLIDYDKFFFDHTASSKAQTYLADRVNINHDGMYINKTFGQSMLSNAMILNIAKKLNKLYMIEYVRRNLNFAIYNNDLSIESDTEFLHDEYSPLGYGVWKEMSIMDHNGYYATAGDKLIEKLLDSIKDGYISYNKSDLLLSNDNYYSRFFLTSYIGEFLLIEEELKNDGVNRLPIPNNYTKIFNESNIARIRKNKINATIKANNSDIFSIENGQVAIKYLRISYKCNGNKYFKPGRLEANHSSYILRDWFFYSQPESNKHDPSIADLNIIVEFVYKNDHFEIDMSANGMKNIPFFIEFGIKKQDKLKINNKDIMVSDFDVVYIDSGKVMITCGEDSIGILGGKIQHRLYQNEDIWTRNLGTISIMITPITPFNDKIQIFYNQY